MRKIILCMVCFLLCSCSSAGTEAEAYRLALAHGELPHGVFYDGKIYWEMGTASSSVKGEKIGVLRNVSPPDCFPVSDHTGTNSMKELVGSELYTYRNKIYLKKGNDLLVFQYIDEQEPGESVEAYNGSKSAEYAVHPYFVFHNMTYRSYQGEEIELPDYFKEVGTIKKNMFIVGESLSGNVPEGSELYAADFQNRFIILKNSENKNYYLFENDVYQKE